MEHKAQREPLVVDELADPPSPEQIEQVVLRHGKRKKRGDWQSTKHQGQPQVLVQVERPIDMTRRTQRGPVGYPRASAGLVVWRGVPSWFQKREPNSAAAIVSPTKTPPWVRKRRARAKTRLAKASRRANRG